MVPRGGSSSSKAQKEEWGTNLRFGMQSDGGSEDSEDEWTQTLPFSARKRCSEEGQTEEEVAYNCQDFPPCQVCRSRMKRLKERERKTRRKRRSYPYEEANLNCYHCCQVKPREEIVQCLGCGAPLCNHCPDSCDNQMTREPEADEKNAIKPDEEAKK